MFLKNWNKVFFVAAINLLVCNVGLIAQTQVIAKDFSLMSAQPVQEKIFAHTDKDFYLAGEILWFKLYDVSADSLKPVLLSNIAYVEILNAYQKPVLQASVALKNGSGNGSFYLPSSVTSGNYILRAYTNWMKNFGAETFFEKNITIVNTLTPVINNTIKDSANYNIDFFPEGGNLVQGIESKVGFKATDMYGNGINCTGKIINESNETLATFSTLKFGMGAFNFTPQANHTYSAVININGKSIKKNIPEILSNGFVMHVVKSNSENITVAVNSTLNNQQAVYLVLSNNNKINTALMQALNNSQAVFSIPKNNLPAGISRVTIFDADKKPVCERLLFSKPTALPLNLSAGKNSYNTRSAITLNIAAAQNSNLSMAVYKVDSLQTEDENNILNYLWFSSYLHGNIQSPQYYFNNDALADSALENLLLTQGWSRFKQNNLQSSVFKFAPELQGHIIQGKVTDKTSGLPAKNVRVYASVPGKYFHFANAVSNENGDIFFDIQDAYGTAELVIQTAKEDSMYRVEIADAFSNETSNLQPAPLKLNADKLSLLSNYNIGMQVQNAYALNKLNTFAAPKLDSNAFYGVPDMRYDLDNYTRFNTMEEVLREYIVNVNVHIKQSNYSLAIADPRRSIVYDQNPLVLVDGVPIFDMNKVIAYNPLKIKRADVVYSTFYINSLAVKGIVSYTTYKGDLDGFQFDPATIELTYDGLQLQREFYTPQYVTPDQIKSRVPDYRNVLYWSPQVNANNTSGISFYTSDIKGNYVAVLQGIDENGNAGYATTKFEVK